MSKNPLDQEKLDLVFLREKILHLKLAAWDGMESFSRTPLDHLKHTGHKSIEAGLLWILKDYARQIKGLTEAHIKKYPD